MRAFSLLIFISISFSARADSASDFLGYLCFRGLQNTDVPKAEAERFCACVRSDIAPRLTNPQRAVLTSAQSDLNQGRAPNPGRFASSGVRDLVVAAQARCEAAFYPPSAPINISGDDLQLTLRCDSEIRAPEAFIYVKNGLLLSTTERRAMEKRMMAGNFDSDFATVISKFNRGHQKSEKWEIDVTGHIVSAPRAYELISLLRSASTYDVTIEHGSRKYVGAFSLTGKIPARWSPCGGVSR